MQALLSDIPDDPSQLDDYLAAHEARYNLKPGTEAQIVWHGEAGQKTDIALVYLHGFRASHPEGNPVHKTIAKLFGWNLYLSRLQEHGISDPYPLLNLTEDKLIHSAWTAFEIGRRIGKKVIIMGTSTGGSLGLYLAAQPETRKKLSALLLYSPLIAFYGLKQKALTNPIARKAMSIIPGPKYLIETEGTTYAEDHIWNKRYTLGGVLALGAFVEQTMRKSIFEQVKCPVFCGYYYKNQQEQDMVVSVPAIKNMVNQLGTRAQFVNSINFPGAKNHVICSSLVSKSVSQVIERTKFFLKDIGSQETSKNK